jgi:hypothetical protein
LEHQSKKKIQIVKTVFYLFCELIFEKRENKM